MSARAKRSRVVWSASAGRDVREIAEYIHRDTPSRARSVRERLVRAAQRLSEHPDGGRIVPELRELGVSLWRELVVPPYRMIYRVEATQVIVDMVIDSRRDLEHLVLERLIGA